MSRPEPLRSSYQPALREGGPSRAETGRAPIGRRPLLLALFVVGLSAACGAGKVSTVPVAQVDRRAFEVRIKGAGELRAAKATPIEVPQILRGAQRVVELADDGQRVEQGQRIALLDGDYLQRRARAQRDKVARLDSQLEAKRRGLEKERRAFEAQQALLEQQIKDSQRYAPRDPRLFSRQEILDAQVDLELLQAKIDNSQARLERYTRRAEAEMEILRLQKQTAGVQLSQAEQALRALEILAPHNGVFYRGRNWRGEEMRVGTTVWSGMTLGRLPDLREMEAKVHVLESEAAGLSAELEVDVLLDAHPGKVFHGRVSTVQPIANPIERESPVKYFELKIALDRTDTELMKPRSQVEAVILVSRSEGVITVPNQAVFHSGERTWVWVLRDGEFVEQAIEVGARSQSRTVIVSGIEPGERVALADPGGALEAG